MRIGSAIRHLPSRRALRTLDHQQQRLRPPPARRLGHAHLGHDTVRRGARIGCSIFMPRARPASRRPAHRVADPARAARSPCPAWQPRSRPPGVIGARELRSEGFTAASSRSPPWSSAGPGRSLVAATTRARQTPAVDTPRRFPRSLQCVDRARMARRRRRPPPHRRSRRGGGGVDHGDHGLAPPADRARPPPAGPGSRALRQPLGRRPAPGRASPRFSALEPERGDRERHAGTPSSLGCRRAARRDPLDEVGGGVARAKNASGVAESPPGSRGSW